MTDVHASSCEAWSFLRAVICSIAGTIRAVILPTHDSDEHQHSMASIEWQDQPDARAM